MAAFRLHIFYYNSKLLCFYLPDLVISGPHKRRRENLVFLIDDRWAIVSHLPPVVLCSAAHHGTRRKIGFVCSSHHLFILQFANTQQFATVFVFVESTNLLRGGGSSFKGKRWNIPENMEGRSGNGVLLLSWAGLKNKSIICHSVHLLPE